MVGVHVLPMTSDEAILRDRTVLVRGGRIAAIEPASKPLPAGIEIVEARGQYLLPGLIDAHVHLEYFEDPGILALFLASGVTTVRNMDGRPYILDWKRMITEGRLIGPTIHTAGPILDGDPPLRDDNTIVRTAADAAAIVASQDAAGYDFIKTYVSISPVAYRAVIAAARQRGKQVAGHVPRQVSLLDVMTSGQHSIEHLADFDELIESDGSPVRGRFDWTKRYLAMQADPDRIAHAAQQAATSGVWIVPTIIQADRALAPSDTLRRWLAARELTFIPADGRDAWERQVTGAGARMDSTDWRSVARGRANRRALLGALQRAGARIALGTDTPNAFVVPGFSMHDELANYIEAGFTPRQALAAATRENARLLGTQDSVGTIEVGRRADLILVAANPLVDLGALRSPRGVIARGQWLPAARLSAMLEPLAGR